MTSDLLHFLLVCLVTLLYLYSKCQVFGRDILSRVSEMKSVLVYYPFQLSRTCCGRSRGALMMCVVLFSFCHLPWWL